VVAYQLKKLGIQWFLDYSANPAGTPPGAHKVLYVGVGGKPMSSSTIAQYAHEAPGAAWYIGGEPNRTSLTGADYAPIFAYYAKWIKAADPTAKLMSASILNWDWTCTGCGGYTTGHDWLQNFVDAWQKSHNGQFPPVDIWSIDLYPLEWDHVPTTDWQKEVAQLQGMRSWLNANIPGGFTQPIWITEVAAHWAYDQWVCVDDDCSKGITIPSNLDWVRDYRWDAMETYLTGMLNWLQANAQSMNIGKWFFYKAYTKIGVPGAAYEGLYFFTGPDVGDPLNQTGQTYREYAIGAK